MDAERFDALARFLLYRGSRRQWTRLLVGGIALLGGVRAGISTPTETSAKKKKKKKRCKPSCKGKTCGSDGCKGSCGSCPDDRICCGGKCEFACQSRVLNTSFYPEGFSVLPDGSLIAIDSSDSRVVRLSAAGAELASFGSLGTEADELQDPFGVAVDQVGNIYVADYGNERIQKFSADGFHLDTWSGSVGGGLGIRIPYGVSVSPSGEIYVTDDGIIRFDADGEFQGGWREDPSQQRIFGVQLAFDADGNLFVADENLHRVLKYDASNQFVDEFGELGTNAGEFDDPFGVAIDALGRVHVSDSGNERVQVFRRDGTLLFEWGSGALSAPYWLGADAAGNIYVVDSGTRGIRVFEVSGPV